MGMSVAVDARSRPTKQSGIGNYVESLLRHAVPLAGDMHFAVVRHPSAREPLVEDDRVREIRFRGEMKSVHTVFGLGSLEAGFRDCDLYHAPADLVPLGLRCPYVVTIHDLMWFESPELASAFLPARVANGLWYRANIRRAVAGARRVIAISRATADAVTRVFPEHAHKVRVVLHGLDRARYDRRLSPSRSALHRLVPRDLCYSLVVGQGSPYKNHAGMVRAFVEATRDAPHHKLVLVRRFSRVDTEMRALLARPDVADKIIALPHVSKEELLGLYRHARMLLFASHIEGFGMPALEAMALGTPVLGSTAAAVREVVADAALCARPDDHDDLVAKMRRLDGDRSLRKRLRAAGYRRASELTWERCARATLDVYREALSA